MLVCAFVNAQDTIIQIKVSSKLRNNGDGIYEHTDFKPEKGARYRFTEYKTGYWKIVENDSVLGWIPTSCIMTPPVIEEIIRADKLITMQKKYDSGDATRIANGRVWIGMTREMLIDSKGSPNKINVSHTSSTNKTEQFIYPGIYVYVRNGVVDAIQN